MLIQTIGGGFLVVSGELCIPLSHTRNNRHILLRGELIALGAADVHPFFDANLQSATHLLVDS